jgi:RNA polymerase subunit RPABC4/transcription elongation factor Spt4
MSDRRCPDCGALVSADAEWCGQCFRALAEPEAEPVRSPVPQPVAAGPQPQGTGVAATSMPRGEAKRTPTWPCPACGNLAPIELDACPVCGTTFADLMRQDAPRPEVEPGSAVARSLVFPGLGHRSMGLGLDGLARGVLFAMMAALTLVVFGSGVRSGLLLGVALLLLVMTLGVYLGTAYEARRIASGGGPFVGTRTLLWITVGVIMGSVVLLGITVAAVGKR